MSGLLDWLTDGIGSSMGGSSGGSAGPLVDATNNYASPGSAPLSPAELAPPAAAASPAPPAPDAPVVPSPAVNPATSDIAGGMTGAGPAPAPAPPVPLPQPRPNSASRGRADQRHRHASGPSHFARPSRTQSQQQPSRAAGGHSQSDADRARPLARHQPGRCRQPGPADHARHRRRAQIGRRQLEQAGGRGLRRLCRRRDGRRQRHRRQAVRPAPQIAPACDQCAIRRRQSRL